MHLCLRESLQDACRWANHVTDFSRWRIASPSNSRHFITKLLVEKFDAYCHVWQGAGPQNWISDDYGSLWHAVDSPGRTLGFWTQIKMHPFQVGKSSDICVYGCIVQRSLCLIEWHGYDLISLCLRIVHPVAQRNVASKHCCVAE